MDSDTKGRKGRKPSRERTGKALMTYLPGPLIDSFDRIADKEGRTRTKELERAMRYWVAKKGKPDDADKFLK